MWFSLMLAYAQNGYYEGTIVFICISEILLACVTYYLFLSFIGPFYMINRLPKKRLKYGLAAGSTVASVGMVVFAVAELVYARHAVMFNEIQLVHGATFLCIVAVCVCALVGQSWRLVSYLGWLHRNGNLPPRRLLVIKSLKQRTALMGLSLMSLFALIVGVLIALSVVDSKYYFGCALVLTHFPALLVGGVIRFLRTSHRHKNEHSTVGYLVENNGGNAQQKTRRYENNLDVSWTRIKQQQQQQQQMNESGKHRAFRSAVEEESDYYIDDKPPVRIGDLEEYQRRTRDYRHRVGDVVVSSSAAPQLSRYSDQFERPPPQHKPFWQQFNSNVSEPEMDAPPPLPSLPSNLSIVGKTSRVSGRYYHRPSLKGIGGGGGGAAVEEININSVYESDVIEVDINRISAQSRPFSSRLGFWGKPRSKSSLGFGVGVSKFASSKEDEPNF